ncbi:MAG: hypothetical protein CBB87_01255 [Micavibrio sp. TMED27]|jgi:hypothetical protein|nr:acyl-CoA transferase [Micavibrio sp.]OUT92397.1 MAG: hypothetical protein CBB87_01255 [Micavibrio sp. TMED27]|tara:strand:- start:1193 stop:1627 length:435 start_codon:yes stop_codon:yes gene_type:complete
MTTTRELALAGLFLCLKDNVPDAEVLRNAPLPTKVPDAGLIIVRDGDVGEPEVTLSPTRYHYMHQAEIEALVQEAEQPVRDEALDSLLRSIGETLALNLNLNGAVDYLHIGSPEFLSETTSGAPTIKAAVVPVYLEYTTTNPLI